MANEQTKQTQKQFTRLIGIHGETQEEANENAETAMECIGFFEQTGLTPSQLQQENKELRPALADTLFVCQEYNQELNGQKEQGKLNAAGLKFHQQVKQVIRNAQGLLLNADRYESIQERENKELTEQRDELLKALEGMTDFYMNEVTTNREILRQLPANKFYNTSAILLKKYSTKQD